MAVIDLEFTEDLFAQLLWALIARVAAVPVPSLPVLGPDRLVSWVVWPAKPQVEPAPPAGVVVRPGELLYRLGVELRHVSVAELHANPSSTGVAASGQAWFRVGSSAKEGMTVELVACALTGVAARA